jgi:hypothetical protein
MDRTKPKKHVRIPASADLGVYFPAPFLLWWRIVMLVLTALLVDLVQRQLPQLLSSRCEVIRHTARRTETASQRNRSRCRMVPTVNRKHSVTQVQHKIAHITPDRICGGAFILILTKTKTKQTKGVFVPSHKQYISKQHNKHTSNTAPVHIFL